MSQASVLQASSAPRNYSHSDLPNSLCESSSTPQYRIGECITILTVIAVAAWFRLDDLGHNSLNHAEAWRANWSYQNIPEQMRRFPPLQYAMLWLMQHTLGRGEWLLRLPGAISGIVAVGMVYAFTRRLFCVRAAIVAAIFAAAHPVLIEQSRMMKVFGLEALTVLVMLWTSWNMVDKPNTRNLIIFTISSIVCIWFTFSGIFVLVAWSPIIIWQWFRHAEHSNRRILPLVTTAILLLMAGIAWYSWLQGSHFAACERDYYFSYEEKAWPVSYAPIPLLLWVIDSGYGFLRYILSVTHTWAPLGTAIGMLNLLALSAGLWHLSKKKKPLAIFIVLLVLIALVAGALKQYPFGEFRMMTFFVPITAIVIGVGLNELIGKLGASPVTLILISGCLLIAPARAARESLAQPVYNEHVRPVFEYIRAHKTPQDALFIYYPVDDAFAYYWDDKSAPVLVQPRSDRGQLDLFTNRFDQWIQKHHRVWFVFTHNWKTEREEWIGHLMKTYNTLDMYQSYDATCHLFSSAEISTPER